MTRLNARMWQLLTVAGLHTEAAREDRLEFIHQAIYRRVVSTKELTHIETRVVVEMLKNRARRVREGEPA